MKTGLVFVMLLAGWMFTAAQGASPKGTPSPQSSASRAPAEPRAQQSVKEVDASSSAITAAMDDEWYENRDLVAAFYNPTSNKAVLFFKSVQVEVERKKPK